MNSSVNQEGANVGGNLAGRDNVHNDFSSATYLMASPNGMMHVINLKKRLADEMKCNQKIQETVENLLKYYKSKKPSDGIFGLENKLKKANRHDEIQGALEAKEEFAKLLERWSMYAAAQEIFAYLLGKIDDEFSRVILPKLNGSNDHEINVLIADRVVTPVIVECGVEAFMLTHPIVRGMIYWLAERCFVRWH